MGTSIARVTAARIALRLTARGIVAGDLPACTVALMGAIDANARAERLARTAAPFNSAPAITEARTLVRKSRTARLLCGRGDLWNGDDRAHQFRLMNEAARVRRALTLFWS